VPLNEAGFPQDCASASPSQDEELKTNNKPRAQYDYAIKLGLGLAAKTALGVAGNGDPDTIIQRAAKLMLETGTPFQIQENPDEAAVAFLQYYAYMIMMVDRHILSVLEALEAAGLRENTIVVFLSDHGEYGAAHSMMMEKWHAAYQESVAVPVLFSNPSLNPATDAPIPVKAQTSHVDMLPTLLGFANATAADIEARTIARDQATGAWASRGRRTSTCAGDRMPTTMWSSPERRTNSQAIKASGRESADSMIRFSVNAARMRFACSSDFPTA
jgi:hypothetical protein